MSEAHEQVRNLLGRYCEAMDEGDWSAVGDLFATAALLDGDENELARGARAVAAMYEGMVRLHDGSPRTRHLTTNPVIEVNGGGAECRSSFLVLQQLPGEPLVPVAAGRYVDRFAVHEGDWRFTSRTFLLDQTGDLSGHLGDGAA